MNLTNNLALRLQAGFADMGLRLDIGPFLAYLALLGTWNKAYNLTAVRDPEQQVGRHILDSLAILPWLHGTRILDVGTGAGLPGIPVALACRELQVVLLDSNGKKIRFLQEVKRVLALENVEIVHARVEKFCPAAGFNTILTRACTELNQFVEWTEHLLLPDGIWLALKGRYPEDELLQVRAQTEVHRYCVPEVLGERCCVVMKRS